ncbi:MAG TPA: type II and III secretion system protein family protein [Microvirga sp.]|jgi:pilus assembly protein CpaC|nr:type II and III secretion system protein family protein [Microvirga sp.]
MMWGHSARRTDRARRAAAILLAALALAGSALVAAPPAGAQDRAISFAKGRSDDIRVARGQFVTTRTAVEIGRLVVGDPAIASAVPTTERSFYILGKAEGRTNVAVHDANDTLIGLIQVEVGADTPDLSETIRSAIPRSNVRVDTVNGRLRLGGSVPDAIALRKVLEIAEAYSPGKVINALTVTGGQQVMLEVRFVEVNRDAGRELGVSLSVRNTRNGRGFTTGQFLPPTTDRPTTYKENLPSTNVPFGTLIAEILSNGIQADILVQALEQKNLARRLAEPNLVALSGDTASFLAGGEVPYTASVDDGVATVAFKKFGIQLNFTPTVLNNGIINLKLNPEVSEISGFTANGQPILDTRSATTTVEVRDGQSFAIAGLLRSVHIKNQQQVPWLGQVPVLGALFRSSAFQEEESDLVIIVTPRLVQPAPPGTPLKTPLDDPKASNDVEFFMLGALEVNDKMRDGFASGAGIIGPFGHIINLPPKAAPAVRVQTAPGKKHVVTK